MLISISHWGMFENLGKAPFWQLYENVWGHWPSNTFGTIELPHGFAIPQSSEGTVVFSQSLKSPTIERELIRVI